MNNCKLNSFLFIFFKFCWTMTAILVPKYSPSGVMTTMSPRFQCVIPIWLPFICIPMYCHDFAMCDRGFEPPSPWCLITSRVIAGPSCHHRLIQTVSNDPWDNGVQLYSKIMKSHKPCANNLYVLPPKYKFFPFCYRSFFEKKVSLFHKKSDKIWQLWLWEIPVHE